MSLDNSPAHGNPGVCFPTLGLPPPTFSKKCLRNACDLFADVPILNTSGRADTTKGKPMKSSKPQLEELLKQASENFYAARAAYEYAKIDSTWLAYQQATELLSQVVELCERNGIEVK